MRKTFLSAAMLLASAAAFTPVASAADFNVLPMPQKVVQTKGAYDLNKYPLAYSLRGAADSTIVGLLEEMSIPAAPKGKATLTISIGNTSGSEAYELTVKEKSIAIDAKSAAGAFYGLQTLRQMLDTAPSDSRLDCVTIDDAPRFGYRGMHFDVSRHFRPVSFLKKQIDAMARLKMNRMHLHLTDGAGWRIQIDSFPLLTSYAAWRPERTWSDWTKNGARYCDESTPGAYGGYYTRAELEDLIRYAAARHIVVIPEIEMPGHSEEVLAAYPELGCDVEGQSSDFCPGKEQTFKFLQGVLDEVIDIFPSEYIHIGGDEAGKGSWHKCPRCQARMEAEHLADVDELQSYLIKRIERYVNSKGRRIIGWDEILEGGVAPNATVMSWRGTEGGLRAIRDGHDVIMTPGAFCYLDYCQDAPFKEPNSIGGYTPLRKVYSYEPIDSSLTPAEAKHLLGVQGNLWTEYVTDDSHAEYMYYPRIYALAEIGWSPAEAKDYDSFHGRALIFNDAMQRAGYTPFNLASEYGERRESLSEVNHLGRGAKVIYTTPYSEKYPAAGPTTLTDGLRGGWTYGDNRWQGWTGDLDLTVDLGRVTPVHSLDASFMHSEGAWVHLPQYVVYETSADGVNFTPVATIWTDVDPAYSKILMKNYSTPVNADARYIRLRAKAHDRPGAWLFLDEIIVN